MSGLRGLLADTTPLRNPNFRRLWRANIITVVGAQLTVMAVPAQIYADTGNSGYVGLSGIFGLVPLIVFGLWGGALADHFDRRRLLQITTIGLIVTSGLFWLRPPPARPMSGCCWASSRCNRGSSASTSPPGRRCCRGSCRPNSCRPHCR